MGWRRGKTYSQDLRERVLAAETLTARQAAERFGVSASYVVIPSVIEPDSRGFPDARPI
jgi:hypothetical protein